MTVIAWDGRLIAADSQVTYGTSRGSKPVEKIRRVGDVIYACTGSASLFEPMMAWHQAGASPTDKPVAAEGDAATRLIVWKEGRCLSYKLETPYPEEHFAPEGWGIASDHVMGAMDAGIDAKTAVENAIKREVYLGGPVLCVDLRPRGTKASDIGKVGAALKEAAKKGVGGTSEQRAGRCITASPEGA